MKLLNFLFYLSGNYRHILLIVLFSFFSNHTFSQLITYDNYTGTWNSPASWTNWATPDSNNLIQNIEIDGFITRNGDLRFNAGGLIIRDTLIVNGNFTCDPACTIMIMPGGIFIINGTAEIDSLTTISVMSGSYFIADNLIIDYTGVSLSFDASDIMPKVFLSSVTPAAVTNNSAIYPVLNCTTPVNPYTNSGCTYGNMLDLTMDPIYDFYINQKYNPEIISHPSDTTLCFSDTIIMSVVANDIGFYRWQVNEGGGFQIIDNLIDYFGFDNENLRINNPTLAYDGYLYRCLLVALNGDSLYSDEAKLTVLEQPIANPGFIGAVCDTMFNLSAVSSIGIGFWIYTSGPGIAIFSPDANIENPMVHVSEYGTYEFVWTESNGVCTDDSTIYIAFHEQPDANPGAGGTVCGNSYVLDAIPSVGDAYWDYSGGAGTVSFIPDSTAPDAVVTVDNYGSYQFTWIETNFICTDNASIDFEFVEKPVSNAGQGGVTCGKTFNLSAVLNTGTGEWDISNGPGTASFASDATFGNAVVTVSEYGTYEFSWTEDNGICKDTSYVTVTFYESSGSEIVFSTETCGLGLDLIAPILDGDGIWSLHSGPSVVNFNGQERDRNPLVIVDIPGTYIFAWVVQNGPCIDSSLADVTFYKIPRIIAGENQQLLDRTETRMQAMTETGELGEWEVVSGSAFIENVNSPTTRVSDLQNGENIFKWIVDNGHCSDFAEVSLFVEAYVPPTIITPNGDGKNDYLIVEEINDFGSIKLAVFDARGKEVYYNSDYRNEWDGIDKNGNKLPGGTYYYIIDFGNQKVKKSYVLIKK